jgi:hypothetical protein
MRTGIRQFGDRLINNDVGLVYYSGHGIEIKGKNYFIPVNADIQREDEVADQSLDVSLIREMRISAIVDTCFRLNVDGVSEPSWTRRGCAQARG